MKIACIQMDMEFANPEANFSRACEMVRRASRGGVDVAVLPETWNTGFFPRTGLVGLADDDGGRTKAVFGPLARELGINIVAGSIANSRDGGVYNTSYVFDREGVLIAEYDKTHLFSPMEEDRFFRKGGRLCSFTLDGRRCALIICYDIRFPELSRSLALKGMDILFVVSQWPLARVEHLNALTKARAIENQAFVVCCNSAGKAGETVYAGSSSVHDPWGAAIARADEAREQIIFAECDMSMLDGIRESINVFRDRRPGLYEVN